MSAAPTLKAPFPYFGGKSKIAPLVWLRLGDVRNYIEPFIGSAANLLARPHAPGVETINDEDCYVANFWRATASEEGCLEVAMYADHPVSEVDLHARHRFLVLSPTAAEFRDRMRHDPEFYDAKFAGWWAWGMCCWIGGGWCANNPASATPEQNNRPHLGSDGQGQGLNRKRPALCKGNTKFGPGVHRKPTVEQNRMPRMGGGSGSLPGVHGQAKLSQQIPDLSGATGRGVHKTLPQRMPTMEKSAAGGKGVNGQVPDDVPEGRPVITDAFSRGRGVNANDDASTCAARQEWLAQWFMSLRDRLRTVRSCCGDWQRVCDSDSTLTRIGGDFKPGKQSGTGVFLDPPYAKNAERMKAIVAEIRGEAPQGGGLFGDADLVAGSSNRADALYGNDNKQDVDRLVARVHAWCTERGQDPRIRIALCCYEGEHDALEGLGWECVAWKTQGGYGNRKKASGGENTNKDRERVWFSPACLPAGENE